MDWRNIPALVPEKVDAIKAAHFKIGRMPDGGFAYIDTQEVFSELPINYSALPFCAEYAGTDGGKLFTADTGFHLHEISTLQNTTKTVYLSNDGFVKVAVVCEHGEHAVRTWSEITNLSKERLCVKQLLNKIGGLASESLGGDYNQRLELGILRGEWGAESQFEWTTPYSLGLLRATGHNTSCVGELASPASYTTRKYSPLLFVRDKINGKVWAIQHLPDGPYVLQVGLTDVDNVDGSILFAACGAGTSERQGFRLYLRPQESYRTSATIFTMGKDLNDVMAHLTAYRRKNLRPRKPVPLMFNDYMNCLWTRQSEEGCLSLIDAAHKLGADGYCFDDGWYRDKDVHGATHLGDWVPSKTRFGSRSFADMVGEIRSRGMVAGLWTELEVCSSLSDVSKRPDSWFLRNEGQRIYRCGRFYLDISNPEVAAYLTQCVQSLYDIGIRYIKNDYNGHPGCGCDWQEATPYAGLEQHCREVHRFYAGLQDKFPGLYWESCASGAMRADGRTMLNFNVQSISDCEEYQKMPAIINGTLMSLLPEQTGIWSYPYPRIFWQMGSDSFLTDEYISSRADGRETAFNMISGMMGKLYLSGAVDKADNANFMLIKQGVELYKSLQGFIEGSHPVYPLPPAALLQQDSFIAQGLQNGNRILCAVWRRDTAENTVSLPLGDIDVVEPLYPSEGFSLIQKQNTVDVRLESPDSAALFFVHLKE